MRNAAGHANVTITSAYLHVDLTAYAMQDLPTEKAEQIDEHLATCVECAQLLEDLYESIEAAGPMPLPSVTGNGHSPISDPAADLVSRSPGRYEMKSAQRRLGPPNAGAFTVLYQNQDDPIVEAVLRLLCKLEEEARDHAIQRLNFLVGTLGERYQTHSAWLFVPELNDVLRSIVTFNASAGDLRLRITGQPNQGIVPYVAATRKAYFSNNLASDEWYRAEAPETQSELAVPLLTSDGRLLGVLNLESNEPDAFSASQAAELQAEARDLIPQLLVRESLNRNDDSWCPWHPEIHGWDLAGGRRDPCGGRHHGNMQRLCEVIAGSLDANKTSCQLWCVDGAKEQLFMYATSRYDSEFLIIRMLEPGSFTWEVGLLKQGSSIFGQPDDFSTFRYLKKAHARGLKNILCGPVRVPGQSHPAIANGVFSIYSFDARQRDDFPNDAQMAGLYRLIGAMIADFDFQRQALAIAYLDSRLSMKSQAAYAGFELIKDILKHIFEADGCSIFAQPPGERKLYCVATTGLEHPYSLRHEHPFEGASHTPQGMPVTYDLVCDRGRTTYLAEHPGRVLRTNDVSDPDDRVAGRLSARGIDKHRERCAGQNSSQRRFLGIGISIDNEFTKCAVIRLIRGVQSKPYTACDERLLARLAENCRPVFRKNWYPECVVYTSGDRKEISNDDQHSVAF